MCVCVEGIWPPPPTTTTTHYLCHAELGFLWEAELPPDDFLAAGMQGCEDRVVAAAEHRRCWRGGAGPACKPGPARHARHQLVRAAGVLAAGPRCWDVGMQPQPVPTREGDGGGERVSAGARGRSQVEGGRHDLHYATVSSSEKEGAPPSHPPAGVARHSVQAHASSDIHVHLAELFVVRTDDHSQQWRIKADKTG